MMFGNNVVGIRCASWLVGFLLGLASAPAAEDSSNGRDALVYKDGDRIHGELLQETNAIIVFKSERFGQLRVPAADAVVIKGDKNKRAPAASSAVKPPAPPAVASTPTDTDSSDAVSPANRAEAERVTAWDRFSPAVLTARVRNFFGPWHGRLAFSTEIVSDIADRHNTSWEGNIRRKWKADEVQLNGRFDYNMTNDVRTTDMVKAWGQWRREFNKKLFAHYRPTGEWNRAGRRRGVKNEYVLLQQEIGVGYHLYTTPGRKLRVGLSQNLFDTWTTEPVFDHTSRAVASTFEEVELALPWRITLSQRGVWYPVRDQRDGWENRFDVNKKLTETLSISVRHEIRRHNPDGSAQDYERLKLLFALDF